MVDITGQFDQTKLIVFTHQSDKRCYY